MCIRASYACLNKLSAVTNQLYKASCAESVYTLAYIYQRSNIEFICNPKTAALSLINIRAYSIRSILYTYMELKCVPTSYFACGSKINIPWINYLNIWEKIHCCLLNIFTFILSTKKYNFFQKLNKNSLNSVII